MPFSRMPGRLFLFWLSLFHWIAKIVQMSEAGKQTYLFFFSYGLFFIPISHSKRPNVLQSDMEESTLTYLTFCYISNDWKSNSKYWSHKSPYRNFNTNTWNLNCNTGNSQEKYEKNPIEYASKTQKKRDFLMESPAPLLQRYNIFRPKANNVKIGDGTAWRRRCR